MIGIFNVSTRIEDYKKCKECGFLATDLENHPKECMTPDHLRRGVFFAKGSKGLKAKEKLELEDKKKYWRGKLKRQLNPLNFFRDTWFLIKKSL